MNVNTREAQQCAESPPRLDDSPSDLRARFEMAVREVQAGPWRFEIFLPQSSDALIDDDEFAVDERLPYWAEIWPASIALVERLAAEQGAGRRLLELGCGVGLGAIAAARAGFAVTAVDYYDAALQFTQFNARHNGIVIANSGWPGPARREAPVADEQADNRGFAALQPRPPVIGSLAATLLVDWRKLPDDLPRFDVVAASDVLYERPNVALVAGAFARTLLPGGLGILADPQRQQAVSFPDECRSHGLTVVRQTGMAVSFGPKPQVIDVYELVLS